jgi:large subunit ribosomal protein L31
MAQAKIAKSDITGVDPKQHLVNVVMTDGTKFQILTTWGKEGDTLKLDADPKNHPAWHDKAQNFVNSNDERVTKFNKKFGNFNFVSGSTEAPAASTKDEEK